MVVVANLIRRFFVVSGVVAVVVASFLVYDDVWATLELIYDHLVR